MIVIGPPRLTSVFKFSAKERVIPTSQRISHQLITICNSRCAFYFSVVLKLCTGYLTRTGKVKVKWSRYRRDVAQRVGRGIALLFFERGTRRGWVASLSPRPHLTPGKDPRPILQKAEWAPGPVWTGGNLIPTGIRSRTAHPIVGCYVTRTGWERKFFGDTPVKYSNLISLLNAWYYKVPLKPPFCTYPCTQFELLSRLTCIISVWGGSDCSMNDFLLFVFDKLR